MKAWVVRVNFQVANGFPNLLEERGIRRRAFQCLQLLIRGRREFNFACHT
jgi:hypothetical protein